VQSFVTSKAGDRGVDVIGINKGEVLLIQCKHVQGKYCDGGAIDEIVDGADYYREFVLPLFLKQLPVRLAIVTSGKADKSVHELAKQKGIEIIDGTAIKQLHASYPVDQIEIARLEGTRVKSVEALTRLLADVYGK
jgi:Holliday junction resolvase